MTEAELSLALGGISSMAQLLAVPAALRLARRLAPVLVHVACAVVIHLASVTLAWTLLPPMPYWHGACLFGLVSVVYLFGFSAVYKSVSLTVLRELCRDGATPVAAVAKHHVLPSFTDRMDLLVAMGHAERRGDHFAPTPLGVEKARQMLRLQAFLGVTRSGLYGFSERGKRP